VCSNKATFVWKKICVFRVLLKCKMTLSFYSQIFILKDARLVQQVGMKVSIKWHLHGLNLVAQIAGVCGYTCLCYLDSHTTSKIVPKCGHAGPRNQGKQCLRFCGRQCSKIRWCKCNLSSNHFNVIC
jgi:hypothetical protein